MLFFEISPTKIADIAVKAFELFRQLRSKWIKADYAAKRRILEITCLNFSLDGVTLVPTMRKPFDMLAEGLDFKNSRDDRRLTFPNDSAGIGILWFALSQTLAFSADKFFLLGDADFKA